MDILRFIATSNVNYTIIDSSKVLNPTSMWGWTKWSAWKKIKSPVAYKKTKVKYNAKTKDSNHSKTGTIERTQTIGGTSIAGSITVTIDGINYTVDQQHQLRGRSVYSRPKALRNSKKSSEWKMYKTNYNPVKNNSRAYWYRTRSKSIPTYETTKGYNKAANGTSYLYFSKSYYDGGWKSVANPYPHPTKCGISYSDITKNQNMNNTNSDNARDSKGYYILKNIRASIVSLDLTWEGLPADQTSDLLKLLSPDVKGNKDYLLVQYLDPEANVLVTKTMFVSARSVEKYSNGLTKELSVTLTEV